MNSFNFSLSGKIFISPSILNDSLAGYETTDTLFLVYGG